MKRDMYGHLIHVNDNDGGAFGVSVTYEGATGSGDVWPMFTFFHKSDDYRQSLFSVSFERVEGPLGGGRRPKVVNIFDERVAEVLGALRGGV